MSAGLTDKFGRIHNYARISVTDRCNLRCMYCMPPEGLKFAPSSSLLSFDEIEAAVRVLAEMGVTKVRLTGGEPLARPGIECLAARLNAIRGIDDISLTTNGILLAPKAELLRQAGVKRLNISMDSMHPERFARITRGGDIRLVLAAIDASLSAGFDPVKLNVVLMKGINDDEIESFLRLTLERPIHVRFIEYMPIGCGSREWHNRYLAPHTVLDRCGRAGWKAYPVHTADKAGGPARYYRIEGAPGTFGLIHPVSEHFCSSCNRLRLTAQGSVKPCLYWNDEWNVRPYIGNDAKLKELFLRALENKPESHEMAKAFCRGRQAVSPALTGMSQIGG